MPGILEEGQSKSVLGEERKSKTAGMEIEARSTDSETPSPGPVEEGYSHSGTSDSGN